MSSAANALTWPEHFPPRDRWKKLFVGVRGLGPDLSFFETLCQIQGERTRAVMELWHDWPSRRMAFLLGTILRIDVGWPKPWFIPSDEFRVAAYGPKLVELAGSPLEEASGRLEAHLQFSLGEEFWIEALKLPFGEVVDRLLAATVRS